MYTTGSDRQVADRLTSLIALSDVTVAAGDLVMPRGFLYPEESRLGETPGFLSDHHRQEVTNWWLQVPQGANTPNWDIAAKATIKGRPGLVLVEAKAHAAELETAGKRVTPQTNPQNHHQIGEAIRQANEGLNSIRDGWNLSRDSHYQLSNRFAWSWKIASLGVPVVLVYLGFLNADEMPCPFQTAEAWVRRVRDWSRSIVPEGAWSDRMPVNGTPFIPLIRAVDILFQPSTPPPFGVLP
jgi:hypothetical protein